MIGAQEQKENGGGKVGMRQQRAIQGLVGPVEELGHSF